MKHLFPKRFILSLILSLILVPLTASILASSASADEWVSRLSCDNGALVIDGYHTYDSGFTDHQLVVRNADAIRYLSSLAPQPLIINERGEFIAELHTPAFPNDLRVELGERVLTRESGVYFGLYVHSIDGDRYELVVRSAYAGPGSVDEIGHREGSWIFNHCAVIR